MNRLDNWQTNLSKLIESKKQTPFEWGKFDCTQFAFMAIKAVIGKNYAKPYLGNYDSAKSALKILRQVDKVKTPVALMEKLLGEPKTIAFARKGDIVTVDAGQAGLDVPNDIDVFGPVLGVCYGELSYFAGQFGLVSIPTLQLGNCYHVIRN